MLELIFKILTLIWLLMVTAIAAGLLKDILYFRVSHWIIETVAILIIVAAAFVSVIAIWTS